MTVREALRKASLLLRESGVDEARHEAERLLMQLLGWDRTRLLLDGGEPMPAGEIGRWEAWLRRRAAGEPLQYIVGEQEFYGLTYEVSPAVLIPRPETELLVEAAGKRARALWPEGGKLLADIGTGSGAIAVTLLVHLPDWRAAAVDLSPAALQAAARNAEKMGVSERVTFYQGDLAEPLIDAGIVPDMLLSNPPYIESGDMAALQREVRDYEPHLALDGGEDGLRCYREIVRQIGRMAAAPRLVGFEVGRGQARAVADMLDRAGWWTELDIVTDYAGIERHVLAWRE